MNVLWIMCDQLRFDYLGCTGHPRIKTPNIDQLANEGVRFDHTYVQSTICGPSRMSAYTGRYVRSHGSVTNDAPLRIGEPTLGDHLSAIDVDAVLIGKTHMVADIEGMKRLGIDVDSVIGIRNSECGFIPYVRDDGIHSSVGDTEPDYFSYLREHGYEAENPWEAFANSAELEDGDVVSGWFMQHANKPARLPANLTETAYITDRTLRFMQERMGAGNWVAHVSYIKPHWPYIAPDPYHRMYGPGDVKPAARAHQEKNHPNPYFQAFQQERYSQAFSRDDVRERVIPTYMGLISQIDDEVGRIVDHLKSTDQYDNTLIIMSSDHGDYLGDHWLGEKQLFHDPSVRIPLIIRDPRSSADSTRGTVSNRLVELIDVVPTILDFYGSDLKPQILEGRSLLPIIEGREPGNEWREFVISEYNFREDRAYWNREDPPVHSTMRMIADQDWKLMQFEDAPPILFDRKQDPLELSDVADRAENKTVLRDLHDKLFRWARNPKADICSNPETVKEFTEKLRAYDVYAVLGYPIGYWEEGELEEEKIKKARYDSQKENPDSQSTI